MARHRKSFPHRRRIRAVVVTAFALALSGTLVGQPAGAETTLTPKGKIVTPKNQDVVASCKLEVNRVDVQQGTVTVTLTANARPAGLDGYRANRFTQVTCYLLPPGDTDPAHALFWIDPSANGPTVLSTSYRATVGYADSYTLCGSAWTKLKNGDSSFTPYVCA